MNKLKFNESKPKLVGINKKSDIILKINNQTIEKLNEIKYLVLIIKKKSKLNSHLDQLVFC